MEELKAKIAVIDSHLPEIKNNVSEILKIIKGDNGNGLMTKVALNTDNVFDNRENINRLWGWFGGIAVSIILGAIGILFYFVRSMKF